MKHLSNHEAQTSQTKLVQKVQGSRVQGPSSRFLSLSKDISQPSTGEGFTFAPSVQSDLFNYLKPHQQKALKPYLRIVKRPYQEKLCISLLDYLEGHGLESLEEPVLQTLQDDIVRTCELRPLTNSSTSFGQFKVQRPTGSSRSSSEPKSIGTIIKNLFPSLSNVSNPSNLER